MLPLAADMLSIRRQAQAADLAELGRAWQDNGLVFTTRTGQPVEPRNLVRSFHRLCESSGTRVIKLHHLRHTTATLLKNLRVPALPRLVAPSIGAGAEGRTRAHSSHRGQRPGRSPARLRQDNDLLHARSALSRCARD